MGKIGIISIAAIMLFGLIIPSIASAAGSDSTPLLAAALAIGLGYGALKSDEPWTGQGAVENLALMLASGLVVVAYVGLSVRAAGLFARPRARRPADAEED